MLSFIVCSELRLTSILSRMTELLLAYGTNDIPIGISTPLTRSVCSLYRAAQSQCRYKSLNPVEIHCPTDLRDLGDIQ